MIAGASGGCLVLRDGKFAGLSCYQRTLSKRILFTKKRAISGPSLAHRKTVDIENSTIVSEKCDTCDSGRSAFEGVKDGVLCGAVALLLSLGLGLMPVSDVKAIEYVPADQMTSLAKPIKKQHVEKGRVWLLFVLGASSLFGVTVLVENNSDWFPAISKANKAMAAAQKVMETREEGFDSGRMIGEQDDSGYQEEYDDDDANARLQEAVLSGIGEARQKAGLAGKKSPTAEENEQGKDEEEEEEEDESADQVGETVIENTQDDEDRKPLFEISGQDIDKSAKEYVQRLSLDDVSVEDLENELERRKSE